MAGEYLFKLDKNHRASEVGNKAAGIYRLQKLGFRVPNTFVLTVEAYRHYQDHHPALMESLAGEIKRKLDLNRAFAVRSSANMEDSSDHSFAGQFKTVLNVRGLDDLLEAVWSVWETTLSGSACEYLHKRGIPANQLRMGVIIQEMIEPAASGVAFSRNPITGARETVIEAVEGSGSRLVQEGVTPSRWTYRSHQISTQPEVSPVPAAVIEEVERSTHQLALRSKKPIDLEWVWDGRSVYWVQMREITSLQSIPIYSNRLAQEMIGGLIKPLIWSVNIPMVNGAWIRLLTEVLGPNDLDPLKLAKSFHYRTYFNMGLLGEVFESMGIPGESLEVMWGIAPKNSEKFRFRPSLKFLGKVPRAVRFILDKWTLIHRLQRKLSALEAEYQEISLDRIPSLSLAELVQGLDRLFAINREAAYYNIVIPLSMHIYNALLRRQLKKLGIDPTCLDMQQNTPDFMQFNPAFQLEKLNLKFRDMEPDVQETIQTATYEQVMADNRLDGFRDDLSALIHRFGHLCDNGNDFSTVPWREDRDMILKLIAGYQPRQEKTANKKVRLEEFQLPPGQGWMLRRLYRRARRSMLYREQISYLYSYGYGLFRSYFRAIGVLFARRSWIDQTDDIFYLDWPTIRKVIEQNGPEVDLFATVEGHKQAMEKARSVSMPTIIYGDQPPPFESVVLRKLIGTATSRGYCTGRVKVVNGIQDFGKVQAGDVLVVPFSEVGWTPLFACAAGVIAESGGMLSHSSIIAREYGIPAVVSVPYAMQLADGMLVSIDGYKGEITVHEEEKNGVRT